jgi:hypothetical protein
MSKVFSKEEIKALVLSLYMVDDEHVRKQRKTIFDTIVGKVNPELQEPEGTLEHIVDSWAT